MSHSRYSSYKGYHVHDVGVVVDVEIKAMIKGLMVDRKHSEITADRTLEKISSRMHEDQKILNNLTIKAIEVLG